MCCFHVGNARKGVGVLRLARMVWGSFFSTFACLAEGKGGTKAIWAMPIQNQHISKRGFPKRTFSLTGVCEILLLDIILQMPSATTMRLVKSRQTESTNASAISATQAVAFNAQMGEKAINLYFTSYSQLGCKVTLIISFFQKWNTCKASRCRPCLS